MPFVHRGDGRGIEVGGDNVREAWCLAFEAMGPVRPAKWVSVERLGGAIAGPAVYTPGPVRGRDAGASARTVPPAAENDGNPEPQGAPWCLPWDLSSPPGTVLRHPASPRPVEPARVCRAAPAAGGGGARSPWGISRAAAPSGSATGSGTGTVITQEVAGLLLNQAPCHKV